MHKLENLEVLWLYGNQLRTIEGLENLNKLRILWIGCNAIEYLDKSRLDENQNLEELNLGGNKIGPFKQILYLNQLKNLKSLFLKCINFGENPICNLANYQTYTTYHLPKLSNLDGVEISEEARQVAEATFFKKQMFVIFTFDIHIFNFK